MVIKDAESYSKSITGAKERKSNIGVDIGYHNSNAEVILYFLAEPGYRKNFQTIDQQQHYFKKIFCINSIIQQSLPTLSPSRCYQNGT